MIGMCQANGACGGRVPLPNAGALGTSIDVPGLVSRWATFAPCATETYIEHHPRYFGDPAATRGRLPHGRLRSAFLAQHPADNLWVYPRHRPCRVDYFLPLEGARVERCSLSVRGSIRPPSP